MHLPSAAAIMLGIMAGATSPSLVAQEQDRAAKIERGRYLVKIAGCNDCHTANYAPSGGRIVEKDWLLGDTLGWRGDWGTTYPVNLRLYMQSLSEAEWLKLAKTIETRPPMPWFILHDMTESDLSSIYHYVRHLGPAGKPAPSYLPPGELPKGPYVQFPMKTE